MQPSYSKHDSFMVPIKAPPGGLEVRTKTLLKNTVVQIDAHPFMQWYLKTLICWKRIPNA